MNQEKLFVEHLIVIAVAAITHIQGSVSFQMALE
jgi:hypothetical protein